MPTETRFAIVGAGIVGLAIALEITRQFPAASVMVLEKESSVASHQTSHNSGVVHSGIYYKPGSLKAQLCVEGAQALLQFCEHNEVPHEICGKLIVATAENELPRLEELFRRGQSNGLKGLKILTGSELREIEPNAAGIRGIHVPGTAIVDYLKVAEKYADLIVSRGGVVRVSQEVIGLKRSNGLTILETTGGEIAAKTVINCAGLQSERVVRMTNSKRDLAIVPFRGEYYQLSREKEYLVKGLIYPVPDPQFPFLGVHFTKRIGGAVEAGPNAVLALKLEGYSKRSFNIRDIAEYASFPGFWKMAAKHWRMSVGEYHRSWSKKAFVQALQRLLPELQADDLVVGGSGVRAQALDRDGKLVDDFHISFTEGMVHVRNVPSPAATASLSIAKYIVDSIVRQIG
ncbi:L-2-hydroxyglutarate oxidase [Acidicapsa ligni]|uniref:L-2-hydroxyglutarate oxidase n=1 Tax=Acidicapsa ligni TaxID=542300 RepID=UPI0021E0D45A|nr:L-2-hydroxyglutarate oxidase [Acidicapsa ligni]